MQDSQENAERITAMTFAEYRKLRSESEGSWIRRWISCALFLIIACCTAGYAYLTYAMQEDANAPIAWSAAVSGRLSQADVQKINAQIDPDKQAILYASFGTFLEASSETATLSSAGTESYSDDNASDTIGQLYPFNQPIASGEPCQSFQIVSAYGNKEAISSPWFSSDQLIEGSLDSDNPAIVDAFTAAELDLHPGSRLKVTVSTENAKGKKVTASDTLAITGIVRPTKRFLGVSAELPNIKKALMKNRDTAVSAAYVYGMDNAAASTFVNAVNLILSGEDYNAAGLPSKELAEIGVPQSTDTPDYFPWYIFAACIAIAVLIFIVSIDAKKVVATSLHMSGPRRSFTAWFACDGILLWLICCALACYAFMAFVVPQNVYFIWYLLPHTAVTEAIVIAGAAIVVVIRLLSVKRASE